MPKIEDYALLGDLHTAALVSTAGSIDWLCLPRFDSPAAFAALLHDDAGGTLDARAREGRAPCTARRYAGNTLVLETDWVTADGTVRVIDFMPPRADTPHLVRIAVGLDGEVAMRSTLRLRFDYGRVVPWIRNLGTREVHAIAGPNRVRLMSAVPLHGDHWDTLADFTVRKGDRVPFVMSWAPSHDLQMPYVDAEQALSATTDFWTEWSAHAAYPAGPYSDAVDRSLITLKALTYEPTGGIVAAATTSLPEELGGVRNWDYRYCWLRDATYALQALLAAGFRREAGAWRDWLLRSIAGQPETLQILYSIDGARRLPEVDLPWLAGYEGSSPVRTGNAASGQLQLDVWGETLDALFLARQAGLPADRDAWALQVALMNYLESAWREPDNGLWEVRGDRQHFTHSKVMAWVAADRMARSVARVRPARPRAALGTAPRPDPPRRRHPRVRRRTQHLHPGLRVGRARRQPAADPARRLPARHRPAGAGHDRRGPPRAERRRPRQALSDQPRPTTASRAARACSSPARSGWSTRCTRPGSSGTPSTCSSACSRCATTSGC